MMSYFLDTPMDSDELYSPTFHATGSDESSVEPADFHILNEKLEIPSLPGLIDRPRLEDLLRRSIDQFPATLISGRVGTGKTAISAAFARTLEHAAWYSVESSDIEWHVFAHYFAASVLRAGGSEVDPHSLVPEAGVPSQSVMANFLINVFAEAETLLSHEPLLIVLDGVHHLFDAGWFGEFFALLLSSLPDNANLLLLCRSKPPNPLWRLRSKQQLNVIDEKLLALDMAECEEIAQKNGFPRTETERLHAETFGRVSQFLQKVSSAKPARSRT